MAQSQHRPNVRGLLMLTALVHDTGKEQRQNCGQHHPCYPWQNAHQVGWEFADHQLSQNGTDVVNHHISRQQTPAITGRAAAHQRTFNHHPDHGAANARNKAPDHPAPEADH